MEKALERRLDEILNGPGNIVGVQCIDNDGLSLAVRGTADRSHTGFLSGIYKNAKKLHENEEPVVVLETEVSSITMAEHQGVLTVVQKVN